MAMSWELFVSHILATTTKVDKVAVYAISGRPVAITEGMETLDSEGLAVIKCIQDQARTITRIRVDNEIFCCVQGVDQTLIGTSVGKSPQVIVAHIEGDFCVLFLGQAAKAGSFYFELKHSLKLKAEGHLISQEELQRPQDLIGRVDEMIKPGGASSHFVPANGTQAFVQ